MGFSFGVHIEMENVFNFDVGVSSFSYTTNYEKVLGEWENRFTFTINKYLSTKLFVHGRFDDGVTREEDKAIFQLQELLSFGLSYKKYLLWTFFRCLLMIGLFGKVGTHFIRYIIFRWRLYMLGLGFPELYFLGFGRLAISAHCLRVS